MTIYNNKTILVVAEYYIDGKINPITYELIACANQISRIVNKELNNLGDIEPKIKVIHIKDINPLESEKYKLSLNSIIQELKPSFILMGHTLQGIDVAFGLSVLLECNCISNINKVTYNQSRDQIFFSRSIFKGRLNAVTALENPEAMTLLTIQPGSFYTNSNGDSGGSDNRSNKSEYSDLISNEDYYFKRLNLISNKIEYGSIVQPQFSTKSKLNEAKVIVAGGRGIGDKENIKYLKMLADCFVNSAVAGSRPLIDMGWLPYEKQVGITGASVSPELYIAVGISGSSQHIIGMKDSKFIISINKDPNAAIFNVSDIAVIDDYMNFIKLFIESLESEKDLTSLIT